MNNNNFAKSSKKIQYQCVVALISKMHPKDTLRTENA